MKGRDPMKGRHSVGVQRVNAGKQRGGQSEPASNRAITGVPSSAPIRSQQPKPQVLSDAAHPSADAQKFITRPPAPFATSNSAAQQRTPAGPRGAKPGLEPKNIYAGKGGATVGARALPQTRAVGWQGTAPTTGNNQVISGRFAKPLARKAGVNGGGYPSKRNASFYGE